MSSEFSREELAVASNTWEAFLRAYNRVNQDLIAEGSFTDVPMREYDVLYALAKATGPLTQSELLAAVVLSQPALSRMLGRLERQDLITRARHGADGRASLFSLTPRGRELQKTIGRRHGLAVARRLYQALDEGELRQLELFCSELSSEQTDDAGGTDDTKTR